MNNSIEQTLLNKYKEHNLASLYLISYESVSVDPELWTKEFISKLTPVLDHPDILKVQKDSNESEYKVDSIAFKQFFKFINYAPYELFTKFIFIYDAHDISLALSNKLLKTFEELDSKFCIILLVPDNAFMLPTVLSRAIKLRATQSRNQNQNEDHLKMDFSAIKSPQDLMTYFKKLQAQVSSHEAERNFIISVVNEKIEKCNTSYESYEGFAKLLNLIKENEVASNFNNAKNSRMARLFP